MEFIPKNENQIILDAKAICAVDVLELKTERLQTTVVTKAKVQPIECFKGDIAKPFYVKWPGGTYQKDGQIYKAGAAGTPNLQKGKAVILFLWRSSPKDEYTLLNWVNGVIRLERTKTNELIISKPVASPKQNMSKPSRETLVSFREKVKRVLSGSP
jgi:hypothetical protein